MRVTLSLMPIGNSLLNANWQGMKIKCILLRQRKHRPKHAMLAVFAIHLKEQPFDMEER
jgi:hypothetical protein